MTAVVFGLAVVVVLLGMLMIGLLQSHAEVLRALHDAGIGQDEDGALAPGRTPTLARAERPGASLGTPAVDVVGTTPTGDATVIGVSAPGALTLLAFLSSGCSSCAGIWREIDAGTGSALPRSTRVVAVTRDASEESPAAIARLAPERTPTVMSSAAWRAYQVEGSPYFVLVDGSQGVVGEGTATNWPQVTHLLRQAADDLGATLGEGRRRPRASADREAQTDEALRRAGIEPGHESLHPEPPTGS